MAENMEENSSILKNGSKIEGSGRRAGRKGVFSSNRFLQQGWALPVSLEGTVRAWGRTEGEKQRERKTERIILGKGMWMGSNKDSLSFFLFVMFSFLPPLWELALLYYFLMPKLCSVPPLYPLTFSLHLCLPSFYLSPFI